MGHRLRDAAEIAGDGLLRTWAPPHLPALFQLDHVLVNSRMGVRGVSVVDLPGSDHRALVAHLVV
jgi:endonuclease/exonuclease/phosphatase family metal-dependent hydrolase